MGLAEDWAISYKAFRSQMIMRSLQESKQISDLDHLTWTECLFCFREVWGSIQSQVFLSFKVLFYKVTWHMAKMVMSCSFLSDLTNKFLVTVQENFQTSAPLWSLFSEEKTQILFYYHYALMYLERKCHLFLWIKVTLLVRYYSLY